MTKATYLRCNRLEKWIHNQGTPLLRTSIEELPAVWTPSFQEILEELAEITGKINLVEMTTATNHNAERDKWLEEARKGNFTTPDLRYDRDLLKQVCQYHEQLEKKITPRLRAFLRTTSEKPMANALARLAISRLNNAQAMTELAKAMLDGDADKARTAVRWCYEMPEAETIRYAKQAIEDRKAGRFVRQNQPKLSTEEQDRLKAMKLDAEAIRKIFLWAARKYGIAQSRPIVISETATAVDVRDVSSEGPIVVIPAKETTNGLRIVPLTIHEVGCHWRDSENSKRLIPMLGAGALKATDETLYEGHAVWEAYQTNLAQQGFVKESRRLYYPVAIDYTSQMKATFNETAQMLYELIRCDSESPEETLADVWRVTYRTYRGNPQIDQRTGYVFPKDQAYLAGRLMAENLSKAGMEYLLEYGTLSPLDLDALTRVFYLKPEGGMPYPAQADLADHMYAKLLKGEDFSI